jgi:hypothetical protein
MEGLTPTPRLPRVLDRVPEPVRRAASESARAAVAELRHIRRPRDLRRLAKDPNVAARIAEPLAPALDRILGFVAKGTAPVPPRLGAVGITTIAIAGASAESVLEICAALGIEVPPAAAAIGGSALAVGVAAEVLQFYLLACLIWNELKANDCAEPELLRRALTETYVADHRSLAAAVVKRVLPGLVPVLGVPFAGRNAWQDQKRARVAARRIVAERRSADRPT